MTKGTALETVTTGEDGKASYSADLPISNGYYVSEDTGTICVIIQKSVKNVLQLQYSIVLH